MYATGIFGRPRQQATTQKKLSAEAWTYRAQIITAAWAE
jgi:hypothetical protein